MKTDVDIVGMSNEIENLPDLKVWGIKIHGNFVKIGRKASWVSVGAAKNALRGKLAYNKLFKNLYENNKEFFNKTYEKTPRDCEKYLFVIGHLELVGVIEYVQMEEKTQ